MTLSVRVLCLKPTVFRHATAGPGACNCSAMIRAASVPGDMYTDLHAAGTTGDPLAAFGDWKTAWAGRTSWTYTRSFEVAAAQLNGSAEALLVFEGIETNATVSINGKRVLEASDSWLTYSTPVHPLLAAGTNTVEVAFSSVYDACMFSDPTHANVTCPDRVYIRQAASSWGWDWAKRYSPQGISRPVCLAFIPTAGAAVTSLGAIVRPAEGEPALAKRWVVEVRLTVYAPAPMQTPVTVSGDWGAEAYSAQTSLAAGENELAIELTARDVELWWPVGYGPQPLYNLSATVGGSVMHRKLGFRSSRLQTDRGVAKEGERSGSGNTSMALLVNGERILARGSSLVPLDTFTGRTSGAAARRMLLSVIHGGMNSVRIWGGGTFLPPLFYEICDELGILLLHDFMLSWYPNNPYPAYPAYRARIAHEVQQKLTDLARHPAIVLWFGGNEDQCTKCKDTGPESSGPPSLCTP